MYWWVRFVCRAYNRYTKMISGMMSRPCKPTPYLRKHRSTHLGSIVSLASMTPWAITSWSSWQHDRGSTPWVWFKNFMCHNLPLLWSLPQRGRDTFLSTVWHRWWWEEFWSTYPIPPYIIFYLVLSIRHLGPQLSMIPNWGRPGTRFEWAIW